MQLDKLKHYLIGLPPETRRTLIRGLETAKARGDDASQYELIMTAAREAFGSEDESFPQRTTPKRLFFKPVEPFLISETLPKKQRAQIHRSSLDSIWKWLERDLAPGELDDVLAELTAAIFQGDVKATDRLTRKLRGKFLATVREYMAALDVSTEGHRRLANQIDGQRVLDDLMDVIEVFECERSLTAFAAPLPRRLQADVRSAGMVAANYRTFLNIEQDRGVFALAMLLPRFGPPESFVKFVAAAAGTDKIADIAKSKFAPAIDLIFTVIARHIEELSTAIGDRKRLLMVADVVRRYHHWVRAVTTDWEIAASTVWDKRISELRTQMSNRLVDTIAVAPGTVRRALRVEKSQGRLVPADSIAIEEAHMAAMVYRAAAASKDSLAINQVLLQTRKPLEQVVETLTNALLSKLREADDDDRPVLAKYTDGALSICAELFGEEYVTVVRKAYAGLLKVQS
ncbi:MAG: hypothetical protein KDJ16_11970 [Hyphomicrobiales bacterium]|nr:hypothetical protein [Hyphomicrobiales bacterium]